MKTNASDARHYRSIFISDLHLGTKRAQCDAILHFLRETESEASNSLVMQRLVEDRGVPALDTTSEPPRMRAAH